MKYLYTILLVSNFSIAFCQNVWELGILENRQDLGFHSPFSLGFNFSKDERIKDFGLKNWYNGFSVGLNYRIIQRPSTMTLEIVNNEIRMDSYTLNEFFSIPFGYQFNYKIKWNNAGIFVGGKPSAYGQVYSISKMSSQQTNVGIGFGAECFTGILLFLKSNISCQIRFGYRYETQRDFGSNPGFFIKLGALSKK